MRKRRPGCTENAVMRSPGWGIAMGATVAGRWVEVGLNEYWVAQALG
jgi:hypothetical protein